MKKYEGKIVEHFGWTEKYSFEKPDGTYTGQGKYEEFFDLGDGTFAVMPYWTEKDYPVLMTAEEVMQLIAIK